VLQLLKAYSLFEKDVEYVVQEGKSSSSTSSRAGHAGPSLLDGLHQAIEAKRA